MWSKYGKRTAHGHNTAQVPPHVSERSEVPAGNTCCDNKIVRKAGPLKSQAGAHREEQTDHYVIINMCIWGVAPNLSISCQIHSNHSKYPINKTLQLKILATAMCICKVASCCVSYTWWVVLYGDSKAAKVHICRGWLYVLISHNNFWTSCAA